MALVRKGTQEIMGSASSQVICSGLCRLHSVVQDIHIQKLFESQILSFGVMKVSENTRQGKDGDDYNWHFHGSPEPSFDGRDLV